MIRRRHVVSGLGLGCLGAAVSGPAWAQAFPSKLLTVVVPYPAGGGSDFVARTAQGEMQRLLGQQIIVENVGGVGGALGIQRMLQAPADGHVMTLASPMELIQSPMAMSAVKHKPEDMRLAALIVRAEMIMLVRKDLPANTVDELVALSRKPGAKELSYGSVGSGSMYHLMGEVFAKQTGVKCLHVPYKGAAPILTDLMGGQIDMVFIPLAGPVVGLLKENKVKALGIASRQPHAGFPQVPTLASSQALDGFEYDLWAGMVVPKATPDAAVEKINKAVYEALQNAEVRKAYEGTGQHVAKPMSVAELAKLYTAEIARYQAIAKGLNLQPQ